MDQERFLKDVQNHKITFEFDDGVNRSLFFSDGSSCYHFRLTTWLGHLCISGDMGCYVFSRLEDMFRFFRSEKINLGYWSEKLKADSAFGSGHKEFDCERVKQCVIDHFLTPLREDGNLEEFKRVREELEDNHLLSECEDKYELIANIRNLNLDNACDFWERFSSLERFTGHFAWCCYAIVWGIEQYDKYKSRNTRTVFE